jgi:ABC-type glutathione transport system ATPase component
MSPLLSIHNLTIAFQTEDGLAPGVQEINLEVRRGEIVALVGESGPEGTVAASIFCGKRRNKCNPSGGMRSP